MEIFNFPYHRTRTAYPENGVRIKFGGNYTFATEPDAPDDRTFTLEMVGIQWFVDTNDAVDLSQEPTRNAGVLENFYKVHGLWKSFIYPHPTAGNVVVKFAKPLNLPYGIFNGNGVCEDFELELVEQP